MIMLIHIDRYLKKCLTTYKQYAKVDESSEQRRQSQIRTVFRKNEKVQKTLKKLKKVLDKEKET